MFMTLKQLARKIKRSESYARILLGRYCIQKYKLKTTKITVFDVSKEKLEEMLEFVKKRNEKKTGRTSKRN